MKLKKMIKIVKEIGKNTNFNKKIVDWSSNGPANCPKFAC